MKNYIFINFPLLPIVLANSKENTGSFIILTLSRYQLSSISYNKTYCNIFTASKLQKAMKDTKINLKKGYTHINLKSIRSPII